MSDQDSKLDFGLNGRVILVTGATGHLGAPASLAIAQAGGFPVLAGRSLARLQALRSGMPESIRSDVEVLDVGDARACRDAVARIVERHGRIDGLVNAAYGGRAVPMARATEEDFDLAWRQSVVGPFTLVQAALATLRASKVPGGAAIVNIASMYGKTSPDPAIYGNSGKNNPPFYGASKAAMLQLTRYLAVHLAGDGVRVNSVSPGPFPPPGIATASPQFHAELCRRTPMGRIGRPGEVAGAVVFLLSAASSYVTGADIAVDGGWTAW